MPLPFRDELLFNSGPEQRDDGATAESARGKLGIAQLRASALQTALDGFDLENLL